MDELTCPKCQGRMAVHQIDDAVIARCASCSGVFLDRANLGALTEAENDWHTFRAPVTAAIPRITADMVLPPPSRPRARSFVESLFDA